jgi:hypothetical protein
MDNLKTYWAKFIEAFNPNKPLGGLEVSDTALQYLELRGGKKGRATQISLRLPPGVIESGIVKDGARFVAALRMLHKQITPTNSRPIDVILTIPANDVYVQTFNVPTMGDDISEAADLNMRMVSPIDVNTSYYGWQNIPTREANNLSDQVELLAAFADRKVIDEYVKAVQEANYYVAAVESSTISLGRSLYSSGLINKTSPYLVVQFQPAGIYFMILRNNSIAFNFFSPWASIQGQNQTITLDSVKNLMEVEIRRLLNFHSSHWGGQIGDIALMLPSMRDELLADVKARFPSATVSIIDNERVSAIYGAALRGLVPRSKDTDISLSSVTAHEAYRGDQILQYLEFWRSVVITIFAALLILFMISDFYLNSIANDVSKSKNAGLSQTESEQLAGLETSATQFNSMVSMIAEARSGQIKVSWLIGDINAAAALDNISISRVSLQTSNESGVIIGDASSEDVAADFKNKIAGIPQLSQVQIPFSTITIATNGSVNFTITFQVNGWGVPSAAYNPASINSTAATTTSSLDNTLTATNTASIGQQLSSLTQLVPDNNPNVKPVIFSHLQFTSISAPITVQVSTADKTTADILNSALKKSSHFSDVQISPETIDSNGRIVYSINFTYVP